LRLTVLWSDESVDLAGRNRQVVLYKSRFLAGLIRTLRFLTLIGVVISEGSAAALNALGLGCYLYRTMSYVADDRGDNCLTKKIFRVRPMYQLALGYEAS